MKDRAIAVGCAPYAAELEAFRRRHGYTERLYGTHEEATAHPVRVVPLERRIDELRGLLAQPDRPPASDSFEAYVQLFQLATAVDNRYFGPYFPELHRGMRCGLGRMVRSFAGEASGGVAARLGNADVALHEDGAIELSPSPPRAAARPTDRDDYFTRVRTFAAARAGGFGPAPSKRERMERFFELFERAPRPANRLEACFAVDCILRAVEDAAGSRSQGAPARTGALRSIGPFYVLCSAAFPEAAILLSVMHAVVHYPDGRTEIHSREPGWLTPLERERGSVLRFTGDAPVARLASAPRLLKRPRRPADNLGSQGLAKGLP